MPGRSGYPVHCTPCEPRVNTYYPPCASLSCCCCCMVLLLLLHVLLLLLLLLLLPGQALHLHELLHGRAHRAAVARAVLVVLQQLPARQAPVRVTATRLSLRRIK